MNKREFLKRMGLLTAGGMATGAFSPVAASSSVSVMPAKKQIGLQLYSLGKELTIPVPKLRDTATGNCTVTIWRSSKK